MRISDWSSDVCSSDLQHQSAIADEVAIPLWVMAVGAVGISLGLGLFGPRLMTVVGERITRLNSPRAYCVALSAAVTVLIATTLGLPVSSTHIAVGRSEERRVGKECVST